MNKEELSDEIVKNFPELSKKRAEELLRRIEVTMVESVKKEGKIDFAGGRFYLKTTSARKERKVVGFDGASYVVSARPSRFSIKYKPFKGILKTLNEQ